MIITDIDFLNYTNKNGYFLQRLKEANEHF